MNPVNKETTGARSGSGMNVIHDQISFAVTIGSFWPGFQAKEDMMRNWNLPDRCPVCGGKKAAGTTTFAVDFAFGVVMVRDVPATVCSLCGADWIGDEVAAQSWMNLQAL